MDCEIHAGLVVDVDGVADAAGPITYEFDLSTDAGDIEERVGGTQELTSTSPTTLGGVDASLGGVIEWTEIGGLWIKNIEDPATSSKTVTIRRGPTAFDVLAPGEAHVLAPVTDATDMIKLVASAANTRLAWKAVGPRA